MATGLITTMHIIKNQSKKERRELNDHSLNDFAESEMCVKDADLE